MRLLLLWPLLLSIGCHDEPACSSPQAVLASVGEAQLICSDLIPVREHLGLLAGRLLETQPSARLDASYRAVFLRTPSKVTAHINKHAVAWSSLRKTRGLTAVVGRSKEIIRNLDKGDDQLTEIDAVLLAERVAIWGRDDSQSLLLTESDVEGWIRYLSLLREVQGGVPLVLSVADRARVYQLIIERFESGTAVQKVAVVQIGALWYALADAWRAASYEQQQGWIVNAPLPPPMTASSIGYVEVALQSDVILHAAVMEAHFGALRLKRQDAR
jgi:hypothetical protein